MKTRNITRAVLSIAFLMLMNLGFGQSDYLKITRSNAENDFIKYPPGTTFELKDENNKVVFSNLSKEREFKIDKSYVLTVNPPYKQSSNQYYLSEGKVEIKNNKDYYLALEHSKEKQADKKKKESSKKYGYFEYNKAGFTKGLTMKKILELSNKKSNSYNATFIFNNGITATYIDGKMTAEQDGKPAKIEGKYLIYCKLGVIKLSYRPTNGETWWFFEPSNK